MKSSLVIVWCVVLGLTGVLPAARLCAVAPVAHAASQDTGPLDEAAVERAISSGTSGLPPLELTDRGGLFSGVGSGYRVILYTPRSWVANLAKTAAVGGDALSAAEVGAQDRAPLLRVVASPSAPTIGSSTDRSSSVLRVVLLDEGRNGSLQPLQTRVFTTRHRGLLGANALTGLEATFRLSDLETLRGGAGEEFFVRVEGTGYTKDFKIKRKHLDRLYR